MSLCTLGLFASSSEAVYTVIQGSGWLEGDFTQTAYPPGSVGYLSLAFNTSTLLLPALAVDLRLVTAGVPSQLLVSKVSLLQNTSLPTTIPIKMPGFGEFTVDIAANPSSVADGWCGTTLSFSGQPFVLEEVLFGSRTACPT
jgi:hypothetical protein